jgi:hypothetical protein
MPKQPKDLSLMELLAFHISDMNLRDYFAIHATGLDRRGVANYEDEAKERYKFADAMLKARNKKSEDD